MQYRKTALSFDRRSPRSAVRASLSRADDSACGSSVGGQEPISQMPIGKVRGGSNLCAFDDPYDLGPARSLLAGSFSDCARRWMFQRGACVCTVDWRSSL